MFKSSGTVRSVVAAVAGCLIGAHAAQAQCIYPHGQQTAGNGWARLVQAFVPCGGVDCDGISGGPPPNNMTSSAIPSCSPPQTYHQQAGNPAFGWRFDVATGRARFRLDGQAGPDVRIRVQVVDLRDANTSLFAAQGIPGTATLIFRFTSNDTGTDMTAIDVPISLPVPITTATGDGLLDVQLNTALVGLGYLPLSPCTNVELISLEVFDPTGVKFARPGHFRF